MYVHVEGSFRTMSLMLWSASHQHRMLIQRALRKAFSQSKYWTLAFPLGEDELTPELAVNVSFLQNEPAFLCLESAKKRILHMTLITNIGEYTFISDVQSYETKGKAVMVDFFSSGVVGIQTGEIDDQEFYTHGLYTFLPHKPISQAVELGA